MFTANTVGLPAHVPSCELSYKFTCNCTQKQASFLGEYEVLMGIKAVY